MARINIEDDLFKDSRWFKLLIKCGDEYTALGLMTRAWMLAQQHWLDYGHVPSRAWIPDLDVLIDVELAERVTGGIYVKGSKNAFKWLEQKSSAGKLGGRPKSNISGNDESGRLSFESGSKPLTPTPTLSLTPTLSQELNTISTVVVETTPMPKVKADAGLFEPINENELFDKLPQSTKSRWKQLYSEEQFLNRELIKAFGWAENNSKRKPKTLKGWIQFLSSWYERAWPNYQKGIQSHKPKFDINEAQKLIAARKQGK